MPIIPELPSPRSLHTMTNISNLSAISRESVKRKSLVNETVVMDEKMASFEVDMDRIHIDLMVSQSSGRLWTDGVLESSYYQILLAGCTLLSVALVALEADIRTEGEVPRGTMKWLAMSLVFVFAIDIVLRLYAYQSFFFTSSLNLLESCLLVLDAALEFSTGLPAMLGALGVLRMLRFVRLGRTLRTFTRTRELFLMMMGILASVRALVFGALLLFITLTCFSVLAVYFVRPVNRRLAEQGVFGDCSYCEEAFDNVMLSNLTFLTTIVAGDSWGFQAIPIIKEDVVSAFIVIGALVLVHLGLLNTIAAVIVDRQVQARAEDAAYMAAVQGDELAKSLRILQQIFRQMDEGGDETLTLDELSNFYDASRVFRSILNRLDIHKPDLPVIFKMLDTDDTGDLSFAEFVNGLHRLKNENMHSLLLFTKHYCEHMWERFPDVGALLEDLTKTLDGRFREVMRSLPSEAPSRSAGFVRSVSPASASPCISPRRTTAECNDEDTVLPEVLLTSDGSPRRSDEGTMSAELALDLEEPSALSVSGISVLLETPLKASPEEQSKLAASCCSEPPTKALGWRGAVLSGAASTRSFACLRQGDATDRGRHHDESSVPTGHRLWESSAEHKVPAYACCGTDHGHCSIETQSTDATLIKAAPETERTIGGKSCKGRVQFF
eukprot:TRINITY_DN49022_c0_g1_i1.p1 TRINITY_DN49022_c0_g1~~TRINITY_DN49022_c0_g1_i1.p1  ORF type:complete len:667 (-),score=86.34 TRINITY_DN49022_c0_g1_i1:258-2258(-)